MDIGDLNSIKRNYSYQKQKGKLDIEPISERPSVKKMSNNHSEVMLPSVKRELMVERKLFLMKNGSDKGSNTSSPVRSGRIRRIIDEARQ